MIQSEAHAGGCVSSAPLGRFKIQKGLKSYLRIFFNKNSM